MGDLDDEVRRAAPVAGKTAVGLVAVGLSAVVGLDHFRTVVFESGGAVLAVEAG